MFLCLRFYTTRVESIYGAFLAFLSLFAGSAIGFLVSQYWWFRFRHVSLLAEPELLESVGGTIYEKHFQRGKGTAGKPKPEEIKKYSKEIESVFEYLMRGPVKKDDDHEFLRLAERRWDMYHTLSSTKDALLIGVAAGLLGRVYYELTLFGASFCFAQGKAEIFAIVLLLLAWGALLRILWRAPARLLADYAPILEAIVLSKSNSVNNEELRKVFPDLKIKKEEKPEAPKEKERSERG